MIVIIPDKPVGRYDCYNSHLAAEEITETERGLVTGPRSLTL